MEKRQKKGKKPDELKFSPYGFEMEMKAAVDYFFPTANTPLLTK